MDAKLRQIYPAVYVCREHTFQTRDAQGGANQDTGSIESSRAGDRIAGGQIPDRCKNPFIRLPFILKLDFSGNVELRFVRSRNTFGYQEYNQCFPATRDSLFLNIDLAKCA